MHYKSRFSRAYKEYMKSPHWRAKRKEILIKRGNRCEKCLATKNLHVHHLTYARLGRELDFDLMVVCRGCHESLHGRKFRFKRKKKTQ